MTRLLPPNASPFERALDDTLSRLSGQAIPLRELWDPATCPIALLPWLAWGLSTDRWDSEWSEATKRATVAAAIEDQRRKGTRTSVETVLAAFDGLLELVEWFQATPRLAPHTFEVRLPLDGAGGRRATAAFAEAIVRDVARVKPARSHFDLVQTIRAAATIGVAGAGRAARFDRHDARAAADTSRNWSIALQAETGEPLQAETADMLEDR